MKMPYVVKKLRRMLGELLRDMSGIMTIRHIFLFLGIYQFRKMEKKYLRVLFGESA